jgi:hypothetical protein
MTALREARSKSVAGALRQSRAPSTAANLPRQARQLKAQLTAFGTASRLQQVQLAPQVTQVA